MKPVALTLRPSCGARAPQRLRPRPPARRQLQPVVSRTATQDTPSNCSVGPPHLPDLESESVLVLPACGLEQLFNFLVATFSRGRKRRSALLVSRIDRGPLFQQDLDHRDLSFERRVR